ncbi:hypothetical protein ABT294_00875 [Nonomuraea sp. NPDC000554]
MTAAERLGAAYMTVGLSQRVSLLAELDRADDEWNAFVPRQRVATP